MISKYRTLNRELREILDKPAWQNWIETELNHINHQLILISPIGDSLEYRRWQQLGYNLESFKPAALEWDYYHDACLKPGSHEMTELLSRMAEVLPQDYHRYLHRNLTTSNVVDFCMLDRMGECTKSLYRRVNTIQAAMSEDEDITDNTVDGYTHGRIAMRTSLIHRREILGFAAEFLCGAAEQDPKWGDFIGRITTSPNGRQQIYRFHLWPYLMAINALSYSLAQLATDYRFYCSDMQVGVKGSLCDAVTSSAMPHKMNPSEFERVCSLDHWIRGQVATLLQTPPKWLDGDLIHSAEERIILDSLIEVTGYMLDEMARLMITTRLEIRLCPVPPDSNTLLNTMLDKGLTWSRARAEARAAFDKGM